MIKTVRSLARTCRRDPAARVLTLKSSCFQSLVLSIQIQISKVCPPCLPACLSADHACCLRGEGRGARSLETARKWIMRTPLIYAESQSAAAHLESAFNDRVKCEMHGKAEEF